MYIMKANTYRKLLLIHENETLITNSTLEKQFQNMNSSPFNSLMVLTILVLLTALFFTGFFSIYIRRFSDETIILRRRIRRYTTPSTSSNTSSRFSHSKNVVYPSIVRSLPIISYRGASSYPIDCIICLSEFVEGEKVKMIMCCKHVFHLGCIDTWLSSHVSCPLCRSTKIDVIEEVGIRICEASRLTVDESDTWRNDGVVVGMRRTRSLSSLSTCVALPRSNSF